MLRIHPLVYHKIRLKSLLVLRTRGNHPTSRKSANDISASKPPRPNRSFVVKFLVPSQKLKWMLKYCSYLKYFFINRLQRYSSRVVHMFRQISYLEPELRAFTGREKLTFQNSYKLLEKRYIDEILTEYVYKRGQ